MGSPQVSLRQMNQTRFYAVENSSHVIQVSLLIGGLPLLLPREEYAQLVQEHLSGKSEHAVPVMLPGH